MTPEVATNAGTFAGDSGGPSFDGTDRTSVDATEFAHAWTSRGLRVNSFWDVDQWVATEDITGLFGEGDSGDAALHDLEVSLAELRAHFEQYEAHLSTSQAEQLALLRKRWSGLRWAVKVGDAEFGVGKLEPLPRDTGDRVFKVLCPALHTISITKVSTHGASKDLSAFLEGRMASNLKITKAWWRELVKCDHDRDEYLVVTDHGSCKAPTAVPKGQRVSKRKQKERRKRQSR
jgi:hypothetical protein